MFVFNLLFQEPLSTKQKEELVLSHIVAYLDNLKDSKKSFDERTFDSISNKLVCFY